jgi:hypothetical protein
MHFHKELVKQTIELFQLANIEIIVFGGWAEEINGLIEVRTHKDLDLLYLANDFKRIDSFIASHNNIIEIVGKRFSHKRAFLLNGAMVEIFLVKSVSGKLITIFWESYCFQWPSQLAKKVNLDLTPVTVVTPQAISLYRGHELAIKEVRERLSGFPK